MFRHISCMQIQLRKGMFDYSALWQDKLSLLPYLFLALAILSLWIKRHMALWGSFLILGIISGFIAGRLLPLSLITIATLGLGYYLSFYPKQSSSAKYHFLRVQFSLLSLLFSFAPFYHKMPGFQNLEIAHQLQLTKDAIAYSLFLNFDKPLIGFFILAFGFTYVNGVHFSKETIKKTCPVILLAIGIMSILAMAMQYVRFEPNWNNFFYIWAVNNLFFVCVIEEAIFRGFIQNGVTRFLKNFRIFGFRFWGFNIINVYLSEITIGNIGLNAIIALIVASILFGLAHFWGGTTYVILSCIAGLFYGLIYSLTKRIEASIAAHFLVNITHFLFFTYPALQTVHVLPLNAHLLAILR